jgi:hypothetical protein
MWDRKYHERQEDTGLRFGGLDENWWMSPPTCQNAQNNDNNSFFRIHQVDNYYSEEEGLVDESKLEEEGGVQPQRS